MTRKQLQDSLKQYRQDGYTLEVKLNAKTELLQAEYDRIQSLQTKVIKEEVYRDRFYITYNVPQAKPDRQFKIVDERGGVYYGATCLIVETEFKKQVDLSIKPRKVMVTSFITGKVYELGGRTEVKIFHRPRMKNIGNRSRNNLLTKLNIS